MKRLLLITSIILITLTTSFGQTSSDRSAYAHLINLSADGKMNTRVEERSDGPHLIFTFNLDNSPNGTIELTDIPFFIKAADWETFEPIFKLGFTWICFDQVNICYDREEIIEMIWSNN